MKDYGFKGWDYTELYVLFGAVPIEDATDEEDIRRLTGFIICAAKEDDLFTEVVQGLRAFVWALVGESHVLGGEPVFRGLLQVKDDRMFVSYFLTLLPHAWT